VSACVFTAVLKMSVFRHRWTGASWSALQWKKTACVSDRCVWDINPHILILDLQHRMSACVCIFSGNMQPSNRHKHDMRLHTVYTCRYTKKWYIYDLGSKDPKIGEAVCRV